MLATLDQEDFRLEVSLARRDSMPQELRWDWGPMTRWRVSIRRMRRPCGERRPRRCARRRGPRGSRAAIVAAYPQHRDARGISTRRSPPREQPTHGTRQRSMRFARRSPSSMCVLPELRQRGPAPVRHGNSRRLSTGWCKKRHMSHGSFVQLGDPIATFVPGTGRRAVHGTIPSDTPHRLALGERQSP